jgi:CRP/FNR family transcriptional regulator, cyclic AMP receptor protein
MLTTVSMQQHLDFQPFSCLREYQMSQLLQESETITLSPKSLLYQPEDRSSSLFVVLEGVIKLGSVADDQREIIKNIVSRGGIIGWQSLTGQLLRHEFAKSMQVRTKLVRIDSSCYMDIMRENEAFYFNTIKVLSHRIAQAERQLSSLLSNDVRTRIIGFLKEYAAKLESDSPIDALLRYGLTQKDIANMVGASRQTVAIILNELRKEARIDFDRDSFRLNDL